MARSLHRTLLAAAFVVAAGWSLPVQPGRTLDGPAAASIIASPSFAISAQRGTVILAGHTSSRSHETGLRQAVVQHFPGRNHIFEFRPFGPAPDWWPKATTDLIGAIASTRAPRVRLDDRALVVRALAGQPGTVRDGVAAVAEALPVALETDVQILDAGPDIEARSLCARQFEAFRSGPVNFHESEARMRPSARPELERVVALAGACRGAMIAITGHTDSSGDETWNRRLSLERAHAVGDWLIARGVEADRLVLAGAGSSAPIATNETRYGRSLNRRIEVSFAYDD